MTNFYTKNIKHEHFCGTSTPTTRIYFSKVNDPLEFPETFAEEEALQEYFNQVFETHIGGLEGPLEFKELD